MVKCIHSESNTRHAVLYGYVGTLWGHNESRYVFYVSKSKWFAIVDTRYLHFARMSFDFLTNSTEFIKSSMSSVLVLPSTLMFRVLLWPFLFQYLLILFLIQMSSKRREDSQLLSTLRQDCSKYFTRAVRSFALSFKGNWLYRICPPIRVERWSAKASTALSSSFVVPYIAPKFTNSIRRSRVGVNVVSFEKCIRRRPFSQRSTTECISYSDASGKTVSTTSSIECKIYLVWWLSFYQVNIWHALYFIQSAKSFAMICSLKILASKTLCLITRNIDKLVGCKLFSLRHFINLGDIWKLHNKYILKQIKRNNIKNILI